MQFIISVICNFTNFDNRLQIKTTNEYKIVEQYLIKNNLLDLLKHHNIDLYWYEFNIIVMYKPIEIIYYMINMHEFLITFYSFYRSMFNNINTFKNPYEINLALKLIYLYDNNIYKIFNTIIFNRIQLLYCNKTEFTEILNTIKYL